MQQMMQVIGGLSSGTIRLLIIEADPMVAYINKNYSESMEGFTVTGVVNNGKDALEFIRKNSVDLVLLDLNISSVDGVDVLQFLRRQDCNIDVIVITAVNDVKTVTKALRQGVIAYIQKPFEFIRFKIVMEAYREFYQRSVMQKLLNQKDIDNMVSVFSPQNFEEVPKSISPLTREQIYYCLSNQTRYLSVREVSFISGISQPTTRRYLEYLVQQGSVEKIIEHLPVGRPVYRYKVK